MSNKILLTLFLLLAPLLIAISIIILFIIYWLATSNIAFAEFMSLPIDQTMGGGTAIIIGGISALTGTLLALNLMALLNAKFNWVSNDHLKTKIGKDISKYVYFPNT